MMTPAEQAAYQRGQREMRERAIDIASNNAINEAVRSQIRSGWLDALPLTPDPADSPPAPAPEPPRGGTWQPIATYPRDGRPFIVWWSREPVADTMASHKEYEEILGYGETPATHWTRLAPPLPARPQEPGE